MPIKILIVEDDQELQELYTMMLENIECDIIRAHGGAEGLEKLQKAIPDLIILDLLLDEISGLEFFARVKQEPRYVDIPVLIATVLPAEQCQHLLEIDPRTWYLQKPFNRHQLMQVMQHITGGRGG